MSLERRAIPYKIFSMYFWMDVNFTQNRSILNKKEKFWISKWVKEDISNKKTSISEWNSWFERRDDLDKLISPV